MIPATWAQCHLPAMLVPRVRRVQRARREPTERRVRKGSKESQAPQALSAPWARQVLQEPRAQRELPAQMARTVQRVLRVRRAQPGWRVLRVRQAPVVFNPKQLARCYGLLEFLRPRPR